MIGLNHQFLLKKEDSYMSGIHDDILKYLPHRDPFLFVDEVLDINTGSDIHAIKRLSG